MENNQSSFIAKTSGLKRKDYIAYAMGDMACCLVFGLVTTVLQKYYTDVLHLTPLFIMFMFFFARIWDAINDPMMGRICDTIKPSKWGRYRPWFLWAALPLIASTILMFLPVELGDTGNAVWATVTYVAFGMSYTMLQIPYGSLASVVTTDEKERSNLSTWRSIGATFGSMPAMAVIMLCNNANGYLDSTKVMIFVVAMSLVALLMLFLAFKNNKERVIAAPKAPEKGATIKAIKGLFKSKAFIAVSIGSMLLLAGQMFTQSFYTYLFQFYFENADWGSVPTILTYLPMAVLMFFTPKLVRKFGKKELCTFGGIVAAAANLLAYAMRFIFAADKALLMWVFLLCCLLSGTGLVFMVLQVWGMATDAIDDMEVKTGSRDDGSAYSIFMFFRKLGQALAALAVNGALLSFGYGTKFNKAKEAELTLEQITAMYDLSTIIPAVIFGLMAIVLLFFNPLSKKKVADLQVIKEEHLKADIESNKVSIQ